MLVVWGKEMTRDEQVNGFPDLVKVLWKALCQLQEGTKRVEFETNGYKIVAYKVLDVIRIDLKLKL